MGNTIRPHRQESWMIKTTKTTKQKVVHSSRQSGDMGSREKENSVEAGVSSIHRNILTIDGPTRVSSLDNIRAMSTVIAAEKLRKTIKSLDRGIYPTMGELQRQLSAVALILDSLSSSDEERFLLSRCNPINEDGIGESVPNEVQKWLTTTFTTQYQLSQNTTRREIRFKHVISAVKCSLYVEKLYKEVCGTRIPHILETLLQTVDEWTCDVFEIDKVSGEHGLRFIGFEIFNKYELGEKYNFSSHMLDHFLHVVQTGYGRYRNPYHNHCHAAEVLQTVHYMLSKLNASAAYTDIQTFAFLFGALVHDYEHTGKTNLFHIKARSDLAMLYNDRSVQENHHISATFSLLHRPEINILANLSSAEYNELRTLVIDMVLGTDMSLHFEQLKTVKASLVSPDKVSIDPAKCMPFMLHCADIGHPAKEWSVHKKWTDRVMDEFFQQGDAEKVLGLPCSPLCDRNSTVIPESQVGFISLILNPTLEMCGEVLDRLKVIGEEKLNDCKPGIVSKKPSLKQLVFNQDSAEKNKQRVWSKHITENKKRWQELCHTDKCLGSKTTK